MVDTQVREKPILFSGEMVLATLEGWKTQTRRPLDFHRLGLLHKGENYGQPEKSYPGVNEPNAMHFYWPEVGSRSFVPHQRCPFGVPGDRLWVRETWRPAQIAGTWNVQYRAGGFEVRPAWYVSLRSAEAARLYHNPNAPYDWRPSMHMPRWACRLMLRVTDVRVERIQKITHSEVLSEGIEAEARTSTVTVLDRFARLWDSVAKPGAQWESNPWVWCVSFECEPGQAKP